MFHIRGFVNLNGHVFQSVHQFVHRAQHAVGAAAGSHLARAAFIASFFMIHPVKNEQLYLARVTPISLKYSRSAARQSAGL